MKCLVVFFLPDLNGNRDITCAQALRERALPELVLPEPVLQVLQVPQVPQVLQVLQVPQVLQALQVQVQALVLVPEPLLLSLQALAVSFLVQTDSQPKLPKMLLTSAPKA
ncbi:MAG: hypothetical protein ACXWL9_07515 [Syntrophales bacterium]